MKRWSRKVKVGVYAALLTVIGIGATAAVIIPWFQYHLQGEVDLSLRDDARELARDLRNFKGAPVNPRRALSAKFIPVGLRERFLVVKGPEGQVLYRSPKLAPADFDPVMERLHTSRIKGLECRVGVFRDGPYTVELAADLTPMKAAERQLWMGFLVALPVVGLVVFLGAPVFSGCLPPVEDRRSRCCGLAWMSCANAAISGRPKRRRCGACCSRRGGWAR